MPTPGTYSQGGAAQILIGSSSPPATKLGGVKSANYAGTRSTTVDDFYNQEASDTSIGKASRRWNIQGIASNGDTGLAIAKVAFDDDTGPIIFVAGSLEGTNGEILPCRVSNFEIGFPDANRKCTYTVQTEQADDPTDMAGGGIIDA